MKSIIFGSNRGRITDVSFRLMSFVFAIRDLFMHPWLLLDEFRIERGQTVVDYGCGPGSYLRRASELVGPEGRVFAVDVHELAIKAVMERIEKENLSNVTAVQADGESCPLPDGTADLIYALDMFHMVSRPTVFLRELNRICKKKGFLYIDDGHQSREKVRLEIISSVAWEIVEQKKRYLKCRPTEASGE
jgi:ubiquinone/menaquinone biosynthesis C-methylase UbiE